MIIISSLLTFSLVSYTNQSLLKNPYNIADNLEEKSKIAISTNLTENILIIFSDGLRYDKLLEANTPNIDQLRTNGVTLSDYRANIPSYSHVNYVAISTGSTPNITQAFTNDFNSMVTLPNLYGLAQENGFTTGIVTVSHSWFNLFGDYWDRFVYLPEYYHQEDANFYVNNATLAYLPTNFTNVQFIAFDDTDTIGHAYGADSPEYLECIEQVDVYIGEILALYESMGKLNDTTIVVMSDHGMHDLGQHGGITDQETHAILVLSGKGIKNNSHILEQQFRTNSLIPTLLTLLGIPLAAHMNGEIIYDALVLPSDVKAQYAIQYSEIMTQQLEVYLDKIPLLTKNRRNQYTNMITNLKSAISLSKADYTLTDYEVAFQQARENEQTARKGLSNLVNEFEMKVKTLRLTIFAVLFVIILVVTVLINVFFKKKLEVYRIFNKNLIVSQLSGMAGFLLIHFAFTKYQYAARFIGSTMQLILPNVYALIVGLIIAIFLPWLVTFLLNRKKFADYKKFKDWDIDFIQSSIGSLFFVTIVGLGYQLFYIFSFGVVPGVQVPIIGYYYAYLMIGLLISVVALFGLILVLILWFYYFKISRQQWLKEQAGKIYSS